MGELISSPGDTDSKVILQLHQKSPVPNCVGEFFGPGPPVAMHFTVLELSPFQKLPAVAVDDGRKNENFQKTVFFCLS